jgi:4-amino-4-deoxy-L-arabinose transferase-like glycosyltransferase
MKRSPFASIPRPFQARLALLAILLVALALRIWGLDQHNIWWDEGLSAWAARLPVARIVDWTAHDVHPPLHFLIQRGWWLVAGDGEWAMRYVSAMAGTMAVAAAYPLAAALGGRQAGLLAALFMALSPFAVTWSQELRMYVWGSLWAALSLYAALAWWKTRRERWLLLYALAAAAGLWTLYLFVTVLLVANLAFLVYWQRVRRPLRLLGWWAGGQIAAVALFAPWLAYALPRMMSWSSAEAYSAGFFARLYATVLATGVAERIEPWLVPTLIVFALLAAGAVALLWQRKSPLQAAGLTLLILGVALPAVMVYALTALPGRQLYVPRLAPRYFLPLAGTFYALLGWGIVALGRRAAGAAYAGAGIAVAVAVAGLLALMPARVATDQYVSLVRTVTAREHPGDRVLLYPDEDWPLFAARYPGAWEKVPAGMSLTPENTDALLGPVWQAADGLWVVTTPKAQETDSDGLVHGWLEAHAAARTDWDFGETRLTLYARTPERAATLYDLRPGFAPPAALGAHFAAAGGEMRAQSLPLRRYLIGDAIYVTLYWDAPPAGLLSLGLREAPAPQELLNPPMPVTQGLRSTVGRLPLTPDLKPGAYHVVLRAAGEEVAELGAIELVARGPQERAARPQNPIDLGLGDSIRLVGYDLPQTVFRPGDSVPLTLYWQTDKVLTERLKVFTHLIGTVWNADGDNFLWGQQDNEPQADQLPTTRWAPGEVIADRYRIKIAPNAPTGKYQLEVGMYGLLDGARLPVSSGGDSAVLGEVEVR